VVNWKGGVMPLFFVCNKSDLCSFINMNKSIVVPSNLKDITLFQFLEYESLPENLSDNDRAIQTISIFCQLTTAEVKKLPIKVLQEALLKISNAISEEPKLEPTFNFNGVDYGFIPNLDNMSTAEFIDIENYQKERKDLYKLMSVLYRPITIKEGKRYDIESYDGKITEDFEEIPMYHVKSAMVFFCNLGIDLISYIQKSLAEQSPKDLQMRELQVLLKSGGGLDSFMDYVKGTSLNLLTWSNSLSTKHYCGNLTN